MQELNLKGIANKSQIWVPLNYKGLVVNTELRLDGLVEDILCVELKAREGLSPVHDAIPIFLFTVRLHACIGQILLAISSHFAVKKSTSL